MANHKTQNKKQKQPTKRRHADPRARFAFRHPADKQSKKRKGQGPTKTTTNKDLPWHSGKKPLCSCSGVQSKTKRTCRVPNGVFMSKESVLLAARLLLCRPPIVWLTACGRNCTAISQTCTVRGRQAEKIAAELFRCFPSVFVSVLLFFPLVWPITL